QGRGRVYAHGWPKGGPARSTEALRADGSRTLATRAYWITSSAVASSVSGMVRPRALAVLRLMANSNLVGCRPGRSAGLAPLRIVAGIDASLRRECRQAIGGQNGFKVGCGVNFK